MSHGANRVRGVPEQLNLVQVLKRIDELTMKPAYRKRGGICTLWMGA